MSESLRNDGRVWVPKRKEDRFKAPGEIPEGERDYYLERKYPSYGNLAPRDISSRAAKEVCDEGRGVGPGGRGVYLDFADAIKRLGVETIGERYGNLFEVYKKITDEDAYKVPMRIYPAVHYTMGGLWVDYDLMSNVPGLFVIGEANFSDHGANRLGASALMQGLADGYFVMPNTLPSYLAGQMGKRPSPDSPEFQEAENSVRARIEKLLKVNGTLRPIRSTASSAFFSGTNAECRVTNKDCAKPFVKSPNFATNSGAMCVFPEIKKTTTNRWNAPGASRISSNSPS